MLSTKIKDLKHRKLYQQIEYSKLINKFVFINLLNKNKLFLNSNRHWILFKVLRKKILLKHRSKTKLVRRCVLTNRNRGTFQAFNLSRSILREYMSFGIIPGYKKAVW